MKLQKESIEWAINHVMCEGDTDLFPNPPELEVIKYMLTEIVGKLEEINVEKYAWNPARRFIIPKSEFGYRVSTQLDPIDCIVLTAILYEYGENIERRRDHRNNERVFSYRFQPDSNGHLYLEKDAWKNFWNSALKKAENYEYVVHLDIADFYNQIYHHTIENQLDSCNIPEKIRNSIMNLLKSLTMGVSRGIPIGPYSTHLLAEMTLIPIDKSMVARKYEFCRYSDDIFLFCNSEYEAKIMIYELAKILDKQQRLMLQNQKTEVIPSKLFKSRYEEMRKEDSTQKEEKIIIDILNNHSSGNPYMKIGLGNLTFEEKSKFSEDAIREIIEKYLDPQKPNFSRLRWFYRRLSQIGTRNAVDVSIDNFEKLFPAINDVCQYFISAVEFNNNETWHTTGKRILELLNNDLVKRNEYFQISLLSLFVNNDKLNNIEKLIDIYPTASESLKRKIIFAAYASGIEDWYGN